MKKIVTVIGARPQFIKAAVVSRQIKSRDDLAEVLVHTGQHFDDNMSRIFFDELGIPAPIFNLGIGGGSHAANTGRAMEGIEQIILGERPDWVLVYGDTDSTLAGALAAAKLCVPVAHVEAGLRSFNRHMPEEVNRVLTDHLSALLLAPSEVAVRNLAQEGLTGGAVMLVGDVMLDAVRLFTEIAELKSNIISRLALTPRGYVLATLHRKENTDQPERLRRILAGLGRSALPVVLPLHPRTRNRIAEFDLVVPASVRVIEPLGYLDILLLQKHARAIATDSGGMQKEAYFQSVPCAVLRDETEWTELVDAGVNRLVGADPDAIEEMLANAAFDAVASDIYGDGTSAQRVAAILAEER